MHEEIAGLLLRVDNAKLDALARHHAGIADLAARFRVERRLVQHDCAAFAGLQASDLLTVLHERSDRALRGLGLVAQELGRPELLAQWVPDALRRGVAASRPGRARLLAL